MCGIFCCISTCAAGGNSVVSVPPDIHLALRNRGPDFLGHSASITTGHSSPNTLNVNLTCTVLHLRGGEMVRQPASNLSGDLLAWNGELFGFRDSEREIEDEGRSDTLLILDLLHACDGEEEKIYRVLESIEGPFAFVYFHRRTNAVYFARDFLGRRSLIWHVNQDGNFTLSSVMTFPGGKDSTKCREFGDVCPRGLYRLTTQNDQFIFAFSPWDRWRIDSFEELGIGALPPSMADYAVELRSFPATRALRCATQTEMNWPNHPANQNPLDSFLSCVRDPVTSHLVETLHGHLLRSVAVRVKNAVSFCRNCSQTCNHACFAVLFSGGIDSMLVAYMMHDYVPGDQPIDLLNVAFSVECSKDIPIQAPDRQTGLAGYDTLRRTFPSRLWNFVCVDVPKSEVDHERTSRLWKLISPQDSVLDCSIATALWFAARGRGRLAEDHADYTSPARVVFSGLGADELLAGYSRHRTCYDRSSGDYNTVDRELQEDIQRIGTRNCGRDDRVISDHGREVRYPFLDERLIEFLTGLPAQNKCDLSLPQGVGDKLLLRLLAFKLGLNNVAVLKKRALQFGSRIAKIDGTKSGADKSVFLMTSPAEDVRSADYGQR